MKLSKDFTSAVSNVSKNYRILCVKSENDLTLTVKFGNGDKWYNWTIKNSEEIKYAIMRLKSKAMNFSEQVNVNVNLRNKGLNVINIYTEELAG
jgi:hypothetical protein